CSLNAANSIARCWRGMSASIQRRYSTPCQHAWPSRWGLRWACLPIEPANMPTSNPNDWAMRADMASLGFEVGMFAGSIGSGTVLGAPDLVVLTLTEFADQIRRIARGSDLPLMVDADHGYGNALNVMRTVEELETSGVAALTIEDTVLPTPFGGQGEGLISTEEMLGKLRAAVAARQAPSLVILGRTSSLRRGGIAEAEKRLKAYQDTGIDGIFLAGASTREEVEAMHRATRLPLLLGGATPALSDRNF